MPVTCPLPARRPWDEKIIASMLGDRRLEPAGQHQGAEQWPACSRQTKDLFSPSTWRNCLAGTRAFQKTSWPQLRWPGDFSQIPPMAGHSQNRVILFHHLGAWCNVTGALATMPWWTHDYLTHFQTSSDGLQTTIIHCKQTWQDIRIQMKWRQIAFTRWEPGDLTVKVFETLSHMMPPRGIFWN